ncbi:MAG: type II toxin-antitoxin system RelB/DinJ family antitoxin [Erysipelotrichaceae bacterium]|jgi:DNA-damage-inducible protein J|nr:type II toxin-antitoxin system RelB/DinJ family antitoxin [Erysipelotrichaceae bacterium]
MSMTNLNIRVDSEVKKEAEQVFEELGLNMSSAVNIFLKTVIREHGIPFSLNLESAQPVAVPAFIQGGLMNWAKEEK